MNGPLPKRKPFQLFGANSSLPSSSLMGTSSRKLMGGNPRRNTVDDGSPSNTAARVGSFMAPRQEASAETAATFSCAARHSCISTSKCAGLAILSMSCGAGFCSGGAARARLLSSGVLWRSLVAACPAATLVLLVLLPVTAILATAATRRPEQRQADYPGKAQTQKLPATQGHSKNGIATGCRFSCIRHRESPCLARFVTILTAWRRLLVPELPHDSQH